MTSPNPPEPANRRSGPLDRRTFEAELAAALYFEAWPDDKEHAAHKAAQLAEHLWPAIARAEAKLTAVLALCVDAEDSNEEFDGFPDAYVDCRALRHVIEGKP